MKCPACNKVIPKARVDYLKTNLGYRDQDIFCITHADQNAQPIKGIYSGEPGTSELILCSKVYNDSVASNFFDSEVEEVEQEEETTDK